MRGLTAVLLAFLSAPALAQSVVVSDAPASTSVTVYRDGDREDGRFDLRWLQGYALISEKRRISLPQGESVIRFEGVADGMIAVSAVVSGLPGGVSEKNRDARLLSPASLLDGSLGNRVHIRRTNPATGKVSETDAVIRSGADNAVVLETPQGIEALRCSGLPETLVYDGVPGGLSAKPAFSVHTSTPAATTAEVTLTYLATGFDWGASYVAKLAEDGRTLDLFAWLTVANGNGATYERTQLLAVAGKPNRTSDFRELAGPGADPVLYLSCWPMDTTSSYPGWGGALPVPPPPMYDMAVMAAPVAMRAAKADEISVTAMARQEELGDLKLYRVPVPVDVVPNGQKQVALLQRKGVPFTRFYAATVSPWQESGGTALGIMLRMRNREKDGLGLPLPSGGVNVTQNREGRELLLADASLADRAVGEKVEIMAGSSDQVRLEQETVSSSDAERRIRLTLVNALDEAAPAEVTIARQDGYDILAPKGLARKDGGRLWDVSVPAGGRRTIEIVYRRQ